MKNVFFVFILSVLSFYTQASNYVFEFDATSTSIEHAWRGPNNQAHFSDTMYGVGFTTWHESNFGFRIGYIDGNKMSTEGRYEYITLNMKHIISFELLYRHILTDKLTLYGGVATNLIPVPMYWEGIDPDSHAATDADNDEGYIAGISFNVTDNFSIGWKFTHYSRIKKDPHDEWIKGHSLVLSWRF